MMTLKKCNLCPHNCLVDRTKSKKGFCNAGSKIKIAKYGNFKFEEPCISGRNGSGTVFFSNCNLNCVYCQNYEISSKNIGREISVKELSDIFIELQENNCDNINLVTPTIYALQIKEALIIAKEKGLSIPVIYNTSGYENVETLKELEGLIDVYLPDFKYINNDLAFKYSGIKNYFEIVTNAIFEMKKQVGNIVLDKDGIAKKGLIIRHLILPNNVKNSKAILDWIFKNIGKDTFVSIMAQYFPTYKAINYPEINRKITRRELKIVENYMYELGLDNGYIQDIGKNEEEYVPEFNLN